MFLAMIKNIRLRAPARRFKKRSLAAKHQPNRLGAAVVEFAVVAPLLFAVTLGMMEVSRMVMVKQLLINASREGARRAVLPGATADEVRTFVSQELTASSINGVNITIQPATLSSAADGSPITVSLDVAATSVSWVPKPLFSFNQTLNASTTMRKESQ